MYFGHQCSDPPFLNKQPENVTSFQDDVNIASFIYLRKLLMGIFAVMYYNTYCIGI